MAHSLTRSRPDPFTLAATGLLVFGVIAGFGLGLAVASQIDRPAPAPVPPYVAPEVCELPPLDPNGVGFLILLDEAKRRPSTNV